jgi:hypothetical protein
VRQLPPSVLLGIAAAALTLSGCGDEPAEPAAAADVWKSTPQAPLSPRESPLAIAIAGRFLVVGGSDAPPCPPGAECPLPEKPPLTDGASFDPATGEWAEISSAPLPLGGYIDTSTAVLGDAAYFLSHWYVNGTEAGQTSFVSYDVAADTWTVLPNPPDATHWQRLVAVGQHLIAYPTSHEAMNSPNIEPADPLPADLLYRPGEQTWHPLPTDPHGPSYDRTMLAVGSRVFLLGKDLVGNPGTDPPLVKMAVLNVDADPLSAEWSVLPDGEFLWPSEYVSVGGLFVSPHVGTADGGETNNWGREYPNGGVVDPETGKWRPFPSVPEHDPDAWGIGPAGIAGERTVIDGPWAVDAPTLEWIPVPQRAQGADGHEVPLPTTNHAAALVDTPDGPLAFVWGGIRWTDPDSLTSEYDLLDHGWLWPVPTP